MDSSTRIYRVDDFIRQNEAGEIDYDRSQVIARRLAVAASYHENHNILIDMRRTTLTGLDFGSLLELAAETAKYRDVFRNRIANLVPNDPDRLRTARDFETCMGLAGFSYRAFTSYEEALEWLSSSCELPGEVEG